MKQKLDLQQAPCHLESQQENYTKSLEPIPRVLHPFAKEETNRMMDLTQPSEGKDSETVIATNHMTMHTEFFLPKFHTTSILQKGAAILGSAMKGNLHMKEKNWTNIIPLPQPSTPGWIHST